MNKAGAIVSESIDQAAVDRLNDAQWLWCRVVFDRIVSQRKSVSVRWISDRTFLRVASVCRIVNQLEAMGAVKFTRESPSCSAVRNHKVTAIVRELVRDCDSSESVRKGDVA